MGADYSQRANRTMVYVRLIPVDKIDINSMKKELDGAYNA